MTNTFPESPVVSAQWLTDHQHQVVILDCSVSRSSTADGQSLFSSGQSLFEQQHIPAAQFADLFGLYSATDAELPFTAPDAIQLSLALRQSGVNPGDLIVVYDQLSGAYAARVWYLLAAVYGWSNIRVLDGGLASWLRAGGATESGPARGVTPGHARVYQTRPLLLSTHAVSLDKQRPKICALRREQFRQAHLPGSLNIPYPELLNQDGLIDLQKTLNALTDHGLTAPQELLLYCGGGINAAGLALVLAASGYPLHSLFLYDDSLNGWLSDATRPVVRISNSL